MVIAGIILKLLMIIDIILNHRWKPLGFPVYCNTNNEFFKHEIDNVQPDM